MEEKTIYEVDGYKFANSKDAILAANELKGIEYLKKNNKFNNPIKVLTVYNKIVKEGVFHTPIGLGYVREMQNYLLNSEEIDNNSIMPIGIEPLDSSISKKRLFDKITTLFSESKYAYREKLKVSYTLNVVLVLMVVAMFIIANTSNNINILNYENKIISKYSSWEKELLDKEAEIKGWK